ncbi:MAG: hypothetical protein HC910_09250 [Spirulinaceae cyanobacterium SM2_1_0]|nr:hypothetical protein [Spirulinaceae cyanobacterium SM2_1_0]
MKKKKTKVDLLIALLRDGRWHSADELAYQISFRFGDAIFKARAKGYSIEMRSVSHNHNEYRLVVTKVA